MSPYFLDTYALIEIIEKNPSYAQFKEGVIPIITQLNLMELFYWFLRQDRMIEGEVTIRRFEEYVVPTLSEDIRMASIFKFLHKKSNMSYADCLGYVIARRKKIPFVTGDKEFKNIEGVLFLK